MQESFLTNIVTELKHERQRSQAQGHFKNCIIFQFFVYIILNIESICILLAWYVEVYDIQLPRNI